MKGAVPWHVNLEANLLLDKPLTLGNTKKGQSSNFATFDTI